MTEKTELTIKIDKTLAKILTYICRNPLVFVSETDVHTLVAEALMGISGLGSKELYETSVSVGSNQKGKASNNMYRTMRVHKEYGHGKASQETENDVKPGSRSDLVIFSVEQVKSIDDPLNLKSKVKWIEPDYILEFGTEKSAGSIDVFKKHLENDIKKSLKSQVKGYVIHIQRNLCQSPNPDGRLKKNRDKFMDYA